MTPQLFSRDLNLQAEEIKRYLPVNINLAFETVAPHLAIAEENYILPALGGRLFSRLSQYYASHPLLEDDTPEAELIGKVRFAEVRLAIWKGYDIINANISDTGVGTAVDKDNRLYRYQEENVKSTLRNEGFDYLDNILAYLDEHGDTFPEYAESEFAAAARRTLVSTTKQFNSCYNIGSSRLVFVKMLQYVRDVELLRLQQRIGAAFYGELLAADESEAKYAAILPDIRRFIVYAAVAEGIGELHKIPTDKGLVFESSDADGYASEPLERARLADTALQFARKADLYLDSAINRIKQNKDDYPLYTAFAGDSPADGVIRIDNSKRKIFLT